MNNNDDSVIFGLYMSFILVFVRLSNHFKFVWKPSHTFVNRADNRAHIVFGWLKVILPIENQETAVLQQKAIFSVTTLFDVSS